MSILESIRKKVFEILRIQPANTQSFSIQEELSWETNVLKNKVLYRGNTSEIIQFFSQLDGSNKFWSKCAYTKIRKIHLGYVSTVIDRYTDIVLSDLNSINVYDEKINLIWKEIEKDNEFKNVVEKAVKETLVTGDGAFRICVDKSISKKPIIDFVGGDLVDYVYKRGRLVEIIFYSEIVKNNKVFKLAEIYGKGYIKYKLYNNFGNEIELKSLSETENLADIVFNNDIIFAVPFKIFNSSIYTNRGKALFDNKIEEIDALDEVVSQWLDAIRKGRVKKYIPEGLIPRNKHTGEFETYNFDFSDDFVKIESQMSESFSEEIKVIQPNIDYNAYLNSYVNFLDMLLQGVISPSTLGIDLKKTDNAESQREKEKITLHIRNKIVFALTEAIKEVVKVAINVESFLKGKDVIENLDVSVNFGEYASPDFASVLDIISQARQKGVMSVEMAIKELYADTLSEEEKAEEIKRIKEEIGIYEAELSLQTEDIDEQ